MIRSKILRMEIPKKITYQKNWPVDEKEEIKLTRTGDERMRTQHPDQTTVRVWARARRQSPLNRVRGRYAWLFKTHFGAFTRCCVDILYEFKIIGYYLSSSY